MKNLPKILTKLFLLIFVLQILFLTLFLTSSQQALATQFTPQISIGTDFQAGEAKNITETSIGEYIAAIYKYAIGIVGILATVILMFGGILWINSRGNQEKISEAKAWIGAALSGLVLALASFLILSIINPALVEIRPITPEKGGNATARESRHTDCRPCEDNIKSPEKYIGTCLTKTECDQRIELGYYCVYDKRGECAWEEITTTKPQCSGDKKFACTSVCCEE